jgi:hypothetical protein
MSAKCHKRTPDFLALALTIPGAAFAHCLCQMFLMTKWSIVPQIGNPERRIKLMQASLRLSLGCRLFFAFALFNFGAKSFPFIKCRFRMQGRYSDLLVNETDELRAIGMSYDFPARPKSRKTKDLLA